MNFELFFESLLELFTTIGLKIIYAILVAFVGLKMIKWLKKQLPFPADAPAQSPRLFR